MSDTEAQDTCDAAEDALKGSMFTGLDRLAFALEMEAAQAVEAGDDQAAMRLEDQRLGVRLAQRFVAGVYADEVNPRIEATREAYDRRTGRSGEPAQGAAGENIAPVADAGAAADAS